MVVDQVVKVASILALPDLEPETKQAINLFIRESLTAPTPRPVEFDPFSAASQVLGPDTLHEWLEGRREDDK